MKNTISKTDSQIKQYEDKFIELKSAFQERAVLQTEIIVLRVLSNIKKQGESCYCSEHV